MRELCSTALDAARSAGAWYADVRIVRHRRENVTAREDRVQGVERSESFGFGVRCLLDGEWGFAASRRVEPGELARVAKVAVEMARANRAAVSRRVGWAPEPPHKDAWQTTMTKDPLKVPMGRKVSLLLAANKEALKVRGASFVTSFVSLVAEEMYFASTEGMLIDQQVTRVWPSLTVTARDASGSDFSTRGADLAPAQAGWEYVEEADLPALAAEAAEEAVMKLGAAPPPTGKKDLVIDPTNLWLAIHETVGHPTELDRALGYEANFAGDSFATPEKIGSLRYGSPLVSFTADRTMPGGLATVAYDDDGVKARTWPLVRSGLFVDYQTTRDLAGRIGQDASKGCSRADGWGSFPFQRMPNISLEPSEEPLTTEDLIAGVEDGIYLAGGGSWSIDPQRYNFQFGAGSARLIKGGRLGPPVRDVAYQSNSIDFWNACDGIGGEGTFWVGGTFFDAKGEPVQMNAVSHGCPAARFRGVDVLGTGGRGTG